MNETPETQTLTTQSENTSIWHRKSTLLIGGTLGAAVLLIGGVAVGAAIADDGDDDRPVAADTQARTDDADEHDVADAATSVGAKDAGTLTAILAAARGESQGTVTSMEANRDGSWSVDLENRLRDETTVRVAADGTASVVRTEAADADDANDPAPAGTLSDKNVAAIVEAALGEASGVIVEIDLDDEPSEAYSVQVRADDGTETEVDLGTDFSVTRTEIDRD